MKPVSTGLVQVAAQDQLKPVATGLVRTCLQVQHSYIDDVDPPEETLFGVDLPTLHFFY